MELLNSIFYFIIAIFILVTAHEFGHFITARIFGMRVDRFFIGFDFFGITLWKKKIGETEYGIGAFPMGGYVKIAGMIDESLDTEHVSKEVKPWEFRAKPVWQRLIVLAGGVAMNMVLAACIFVGITAIFGESHTPITTPAFIEENSPYASIGFRNGDHLVAINGQKLKFWEDAVDPEHIGSGQLQYTILRDGKELTLTAPKDITSRINESQSLGIRPTMPPVIDQVLAGDPAAKAGIKPGALIVSINNTPVTDWSEVVGIISKNPGRKLTITWQHLKTASAQPLTAEMIRNNGETYTTEVVPNQSGKIGISLMQTVETERISLPFPQAAVSGVKQTWKYSVMIVTDFSRLFTGQADVRKSVGGPIKIASMANQSAKQGPVSFLVFVAVLSISLAIINILPIPALDGGQFFLNAVEGVIGREIPFEVKMRIQQIGMALLLALFAYFMINDLLNL